MGYPSSHFGPWPPLQATSQLNIQITYPKLSKIKRSQKTTYHTSILKQATKKYQKSLIIITYSTKTIIQIGLIQESKHKPIHVITWHHQEQIIQTPQSYTSGWKAIQNQLIKDLKIISDRSYHSPQFHIRTLKSNNNQ